ncbi:MAG: hypothetical protein JKY48_01585 [Flavobacteriales bacterium]|nr:hypothetical protein [Flavobacteriales bacterium]
MSKKIKLIWDFFGEDGLKTAEHHAIHLKEFAAKEQISAFEVGVEKSSPDQSLAFMIVAEENMIAVRDALRPKRGQWVEEK